MEHPEKAELMAEQIIDLFKPIIKNAFDEGLFLVRQSDINIVKQEFLKEFELL